MEQTQIEQSISLQTGRQAKDSRKTRRSYGCVAFLKRLFPLSHFLSRLSHVREKWNSRDQGDKKKYKYLLKDWQTRCGQQNYGGFWSCRPSSGLPSLLPALVSGHCSLFHHQKEGRKPGCKTKNWKCGPVGQIWSLGPCIVSKCFI